MIAETWSFFNSPRFFSISETWLTGLKSIVITCLKIWWVGQFFISLLVIWVTPIITYQSGCFLLTSLNDKAFYSTESENCSLNVFNFLTWFFILKYSALPGQRSRDHIFFILMLAVNWGCYCNLCVILCVVFLLHYWLVGWLHVPAWVQVFL